VLSHPNGYAIRTVASFNLGAKWFWKGSTRGSGLIDCHGKLDFGRGTWATYCTAMKSMHSTSPFEFTAKRVGLPRCASWPAVHSAEGQHPYDSRRC
jgi:hypothetical protein